MPLGAPIPRLMATRAYGAHVEKLDNSIDECLVGARQFEARTGAVLIYPLDHPDIVAGPATCGLEILQQCPDVQTIVVSLGGGGLLAGIATAVKASRPRVRIIASPGGEGRAVPAVPGRRPSGASGGHGHDGRRHRRRLPGPGAVRDCA